MFALYTNVSKQLMKRKKTLPAVAMTFTLCALILLPLAAKDGFSRLTAGVNIWAMLFMAVAATSLVYILFLGGEHLTVVAWIGVSLL